MSLDVKVESWTKRVCLGFLLVLQLDPENQCHLSPISFSPCTSEEDNFRTNVFPQSSMVEQMSLRACLAVGGGEQEGSLFAEFGSRPGIWTCSACWQDPSGCSDEQWLCNFPFSLKCTAGCPIFLKSLSFKNLSFWSKCVIWNLSWLYGKWNALSKHRLSGFFCPVFFTGTLLSI